MEEKEEGRVIMSQLMPVGIEPMFSIDWSNLEREVEDSSHI